MSMIKYGFLAVAATLMMMPEASQAQTFTQRGTRNGAIAGAIIGGIVGANRDRPLAGAALGGLIGGAAGRAIGNSKDQRFFGGQFNNGRQFHHGVNHFQPLPIHRTVPHSFARPVYGGGFHGGGFHHGGFHGRPGFGW